MHITTVWGFTDNQYALFYRERVLDDSGMGSDIWIWDGIRLLKNVLQYERRKHHGLEERKRTVL